MEALPFQIQRSASIYGQTRHDHFRLLALPPELYPLGSRKCGQAPSSFLPADPAASTFECLPTGSALRCRPGWRHVRSAPVSRWRWILIAFAFLATAINYLDRQSLSVAAPLLRIQFHMSHIGYSRVLFAFLLAYTVMNGLSGIVIDRLGTRLGYAAFVGWWSLSSLLQIFAEHIRCNISLGRVLTGPTTARYTSGAPAHRR